jgi:type IV pilus assembly protein PilY1
MSRHHTAHARFRKTLLALAAGAALASHGVWALDMAQSPPGTVEPYVRPNVIVSVDDSGSMDWQLTNTSTGSTTITAPNPDGSWDTHAKRINILKYALKQVFNDPTLVPEAKIRLSWQALWNNGKSPGVGVKKDDGSATSNAGANSVDNGTASPSVGDNSMKVLSATHRANFLNFVNKLSTGNGTPAHWMFSQADTYMRRGLNTNGPWAAEPGTTGTPYLACRRNYHIMMTDGRWNGAVSGGTQDDNTKDKTLLDDTVFGSSIASTRPYNNLYHDPFGDTLADWAFYSWATPLQTSGLTGTMQPTADYRKAPATENFGKDNSTPKKDAVLDRYWNPRYDPATWPHLVTYTIGISTDATTWPGAPTFVAPSQRVPFGYDNSFPDLVTGNKKWPNMGTGENVRALDLWHAALNGRGRFYAVMKGEDLEKAFREIMGQINTQTEPDLTSTATSGSNSSRNDVGKFTGAYEPKNAWKGFVNADTVRKDGTTVPNAGWAGKNTADKLDALDASGLSNRLVLSWSDKWDSTAYKGGVPFKWANDEANLSTAQKALLGLNPGDPAVTVTTNGQNRLNFIRGDRSLEGSDTSGYTTAKPFRERKSRQGDIINSVVWYTGAPSASYALNGYAAFLRCTKARQSMIYVGGNDGMLHGFSATDGTEKIAYVPKGLVPSLPLLGKPEYNSQHRSFVDGSPMTGDVDMGTGVVDPNDPCNTNGWRTLLVGTLGGGGRGYFVLDVTNPATTAGSAPAFVEGNAQQLVKLDRTRSIESGTAPNCALTGMVTAEKAACTAAESEDRDIGHITARPVQSDTDSMRTTQIARMNNNRWAVVLGNGYNSANQRPVLLVQYLDGAKELLRIAATTDAPGTGKAVDNGLSAPRLVDINGDGSPDVAYAGDNLGNLWKFDLTNVDATQWGVAFGGIPLFTAKGPASLGNASRTKVQPITVAPMVRANDRTMIVGTGASATTVAVSGMMVAFGTGRNVDKDDASSIDVQTLYSVLDNTRYRTVVTAQGKRLEIHPGGGTCPGGANCVPAPAALGEGVTTAKLAQQKLTELSGGFATVDVVNDLKQSSWASYNGWYLDLPAVGERLLKPMESYDGSNIMTVLSQVPAKGSDVDPNIESCDSSSVDEERQRITLVNIMDGKRPTVQLVDMNGDGFFSTADNGVSSAMVSKGSHNFITNGTRIDDIDSRNFKKSYARMPEQSLRPSWRQLK